MVITIITAMAMITTIITGMTISMTAMAATPICGRPMSMCWPMR